MPYPQYLADAEYREIATKLKSDYVGNVKVYFTALKFNQNHRRFINNNKNITRLKTIFKLRGVFGTWKIITLQP